jgi:uncharacterized protein (TIGR03000 family)
VILPSLLEYCAMIGKLLGCSSEEFYRSHQKEKTMNRLGWKSLVFGIVVVIALFTAVNQSSAWWGGCCGGPLYGPFPAYTAWDSCCGSDLYLGWRPGPVRRLLFGPYRWYAGLYSGTCCGYYTPCYSCYPSYASGCCGADTIYYGTPATVPGKPTPAAPTPASPNEVKKPTIEGPNAPAMPNEPGMPEAPTAPAPGITPEVPTTPTPTTEVTPENTGVLTVWVPYDAKVVINGMATKSTGSHRQFVSYNLKPGFNYKYEIKAEVVRDGKIIEDTKTIVLSAGSNSSVAFGFNMGQAEGLASN